MAVPGGHLPGGDIYAYLDDLAPRDAQVVPLEIGALNPRLLRPRHVQRQTASDDQHRHRHDASRFHVELLLSFKSRPDDLCAGRSDLKAALTSAAKSPGCSHAAKCPPSSTSSK